jgi:chemotaxis protein CheX
MSRELATLRLSAILDLKAAAPLKADLLAAKDHSVEIDAAHVQRLGGLCLQVLLAAQRSWAIEGKTLRVINPSTDFADGLALFGAASLNADSSGVRL